MHKGMQTAVLGDGRSLSLAFFLNERCRSASFRSNLLYGVGKADTSGTFPTFFYVEVLSIKNMTV